MDFQELTKELRRRGKTVAEIADKCECSRSAIYMLLRGDNKQPAYDLGLKLVDLERRTRARK